jgi:hypothetical protein
LNPRTTGMLALVAALLGGFIYFYEIRGESERESLRDDAKRIHPGLDAEAVESVDLTTADGIDARFERREGRWEVVSPVAGGADAAALDAIAHALTSLPREGSVDGSVDSSVGKASDLEQYGLGANARVVLFEVAGATKGIRIGKATPVGGHVYVARLADDDVAYVESYRVNPFNHPLDDLRDRRILDFDALDVRTLRVSWPSAEGEMVEVALARKASGEWQMGVPTVGPADESTLRELLTDLSFLRAKGFVDERSENAIAALDDEAIIFHWTLPNDHIEQRARIGGRFDGGLIMEAPDGALRTIDAERIDDFRRSITDYRFKDMANFEISDARRLVLDFSPAGVGATQVEAHLGESGWSGDAPSIDPERARDLVRTLSTLRAEDIFADEMGPNELASLGLSPPNVAIRVEDTLESEDKTQVLADIVIGRLDVDRGIFAQRAGNPAIFLLPREIADEIPISLEAFSEAFALREGESSEEEEESDLELLRADPLEGVELP